MVVWFCVGVNVAYVFAAAYVTYCIARSKRAHEELSTALAVTTGGALSWLVGYMVVGPVWALLTVPALLAAVVACLRVYAYMREQAVRVRSWRRVD
jgi:hypothetical protein